MMSEEMTNRGTVNKGIANLKKAIELSTAYFDCIKNRYKKCDPNCALYNCEDCSASAVLYDVQELLQELLKQQEPVPPVITRDIKTIVYCGNCGHKLAPYGYCAKCGKAVKWHD